MTEDEARAKGIAILLLLATEWGLSEWLARFDQDAIENIKESVIEILRAEITV